MHALWCKTDTLQSKEGALITDQSPETLNKIAYFDKHIKTRIDELVKPNDMCIKLNALEDTTASGVLKFLEQEPLTRSNLKQSYIDHPEYEPEEHIFFVLQKLQILWSPRMRGDTKFNNYIELEYDNHPVYVIASDNSIDMGTTVTSRNQSIEPYIKLDLTTAWSVHDISAQSLKAANLEHLQISFPHFIVAVLEQESYHASNTNDTERQSELVSLKVGWQFYVMNRILPAAQGANLDKFPELKEELLGLKSKGYIEMYINYAKIFKEFAPTYVPLHSNSREENIKAKIDIIQKNPGILTYMCKKALEVK